MATVDYALDETETDEDVTASEDADTDDVEADEYEAGPDDTTEEDEEDDDSDDDAAVGDSAAAKTRTAQRAGIDRAKARRIATKTLEVNEGDPGARSVLALLLGVEDSPVALTVAIQTGSRTSLSYLDVLEQAMGEDAIGIGVMVSTMDRDVLRQVWTLSRLLGADLPEKVPAAGRNTAVALARTLADMPAGTNDKVSAIRNLAKRS